MTHLRSFFVYTISFCFIFSQESNNPIISINVSEEKAKKIAFIGDSFTQGKPWASLTVKSLNNNLITEGYSLGVSGYSTLQSFLKLKKYFEEINPEFKRIKFKTGQKVFDWIIPKEWNIRDAWQKF